MAIRQNYLMAMLTLSHNKAKFVPGKVLLNGYDDPVRRIRQRVVGMHSTESQSFRPEIDRGRSGMTVECVPTGLAKDDDLIV